MSTKTTWSLVFVAAILFAFIFFFEWPYRKALSQPPELHVFPGFNFTNVTRIQIQPANQVDMVVERTNSNWQLSQPISYSADRWKIELFLQKLAQLTMQGHITARELQERSDAQEEFGFDSKQLQFSIALEEGGHRRHLLIGKKMAVGEQVFAQVLGADGYYVIDSEFLKFIPRTEANWRDHSIANWSEIVFDTLRSKAANNSFELHFSATNFLWHMTKPLETRANNAKVNELLQKISTNEVSEFVSDDANADLDKFGLQPPALEIVFARGTNDLFALQLGKSPTNNPTQVFAKRRNHNTIFLIPAEPLAAWRLPYSDFRERHLANLPEKEIDHIEVSGEDKFVLTKQDDGAWAITGQPFTADADLVQEFLLRLDLAEIEVEKNVVTDFSTYGLAEPLLHYTLKVAHQSPTNRLRADPITQIDFGTNNGKIFAHRSDETSVSSIKLEDFQFFPRASWQMRNRQVWNFDSTNIVNVLIQQKGQSRQLIRNAKGDWIIAPGSQGIIDNIFALEEALHRLGQLKAVFWTARGEANWAKFGFKETDHQISLQLKRDGKIETLDLQFGGLSEFQHPYAAVTLNGEKLIFEFPWVLYYDFVLRDLSILPTSFPGTK
ncbi:MAG: hypothetical protein JWM68_2842 [Verrucomicrobiales bacterium]|nr:hypothetical protein [Verrucomicrobiales bacterium]